MDETRTIVAWVGYSSVGKMRITPRQANDLIDLLRCAVEEVEGR